MRKKTTINTSINQSDSNLSSDIIPESGRFNLHAKLPIARIKFHLGSNNCNDGIIATYEYVPLANFKVHILLLLS